jgi:hypothetical protein
MEEIYESVGSRGALNLSRGPGRRRDWDEIRVAVVRNFILGANPTNMQLDDICCLPEVCKWGTTCAGRTH